MNLQFRAEFFNVLNHANFGTPNATVFSSGAISPSAGLITTHGDDVAADSVRVEADFLRGFFDQADRGEAKLPQFLRNKLVDLFGQ